MPAAAWWAHAASGRLTWRVLAWGALLISVAVTLTLCGVDRGALLYNSRDGSAKLLLWLSPLVDVTTGLPGGCAQFDSAVLDQSGVRYLNEGGSYEAYCEGMLVRNKTVPAVPSWAIMDSQFLARYPLANGGQGKAIPDEWRPAEDEAGLEDAFERQVHRHARDAAGAREHLRQHRARGPRRCGDVARRRHRVDVTRGEGAVEQRLEPVEHACPRVLVRQPASSSSAA